jgi:membrane protein DedA with SNARE-associated domain
VLGACALDAVLPIVPSEAVVIATSILATRGELSIWLVAVAAAAGGFLGDTGSYGLGRTVGAAAARRLFPVQYFGVVNNRSDHQVLPSIIGSVRPAGHCVAVGPGGEPGRPGG